MPKKRIDFAQEDRELAERVVFLLDAHPRRPVERIFDLVGYGEPGPLLQFGLRRWADAQRVSPRLEGSKVARLQAQVRRDEATSRTSLVEALRLVKHAAAKWNASIEGQRRVTAEGALAQKLGLEKLGLVAPERLPQGIDSAGVAQGAIAREFPPVIAAISGLLAAAVAEELKGPPGHNDFPTLIGLGSRERSRALSEQASRLERGQVSRDDVAFLFADAPATDEAARSRGRDRIGQRLRRVRNNPADDK